MNGVRKVALTPSWIFAGAALTGCVSHSGQSGVTVPGVFASIEVGAAQFINVDTLGDALEVEEDTSPSIQLGVGYQVNKNVAVEFRAGDLGAVEFTDGREITYQLADLSGLYLWRQRNTSFFGRLGFGTFINDGDFDIELESPVHVVAGAGVAFHASPSLDVRLSVSAHGADAVVGNAGLVWRFGSKSPRTPPIGTVPNEQDDGFKAIAPVTLEEADVNSAVTPSTTGEETSNGLVIDEKPIPTLQTYPEPTVPNDVTTSIDTKTEAAPTQVRAPIATDRPTSAPITAPEQELATLQTTAPEQELATASIPEQDPMPDQEPITEPDAGTVLTPEVDAVNITGKPAENLFAIDTLLDVRPIQFAQGVTTLTDDSTVNLGEVVEIMNSNPQLRLQVESHAAPIGSAELNMLLSRRRALSVMRLLIDQGIDAVRLRPRAFGDTAPIADAVSIEDNDRVEFRIR